MARQGLNKTSKAISSGRLVGSAKAPICRKRAPGRKNLASSVDSGYSLYSTDSEDQVATIHKGLDRCAALLKGILQTEKADVKPSSSKPGKIATKMTSVKGKNDKRKEIHRSTVSCTLKKSTGEKGIMPLCTSLGNEQKEHGNLGQHSGNQQLVIQCTASGPGAQQVHSDHIQTPTSLVHQVPVCSAPSQIPFSTGAAATQSPTKFNCRLTTSTPTLPPQNSLSPSHMPLTTSRDIHKEGAQQGGITYFPVHISPAPLPTVLQVPLHIASQAAVAQVIPHAPCPNEGGLQQGNTRDQDLLRQIQMHLSHLQHHQVEGWQPVVSSQVQDPTQTQASAELSESEHSEWTTSEDELDSVDHTPVRDTSCQTSFDKQNLLRMKSASPDQTMKKVQTVKYLLGELKALVAEKGDDPEVFRVITEVEDNISLLPTMVGSTNVQAEIALALQPLRSENAQLRRRLRIVNQQLRERERAEKELNPLDVNFELISVQSLNMTLQAQLKESNKSIELLQKKCEELLKAVDEQKVQNQELLNTIQNKEGEIMLIRQQCDSDINSIKTDIEEALSKMKNIQFQLETSEKENQVLKLNLQQRDAEVTRLHELTRNVQESMVRLISELGVDNNKLKTASRLTQTLLEQFESQPIEDPALNPVRGMVKKYFDTLMVEHHSSLQTDEGFSDKLDVGSLENFNHGSKPSLSNSKENDFAVLTARTSPSREFTSKFLSEFEHKGSVSLNERGKVHEAAHFPVFGTAKLSNDAATKASTTLSGRKTIDCNSGALDRQPQNDGKTSPSAFINLQRSHNPVVLSNFEKFNTLAESLGTRTSEEKKITDTKDHLVKKYFPNSALQKINQGPKYRSTPSIINSACSVVEFDCAKSDWSMGSATTFNTRDEQDFRNGLAALDASIANLQRTIKSDLKR
ncbi:coiled-coil domain-containing protein 14 [Polypterus senegalus]|uniref:coiled-coil domain-containing protein 14 n=1 Tax=Polypterus senegalus TaxID=55291 RepID=UPI00196332B2|nr:coiled-coil domain-containing protein 14 [Polypterus senegalus]